MKVFVGQTESRRYVRILRELGVGRVWSRGNPRPASGETWILDNGAYSAWTKGLPFPADRFRGRVVAAPESPDPYFAVLPDAVGAGTTSLEFSLGWLDELAGARPQWLWYLAVQDGVGLAAVRAALETHPRVAGLFLGGTTRFKATAPEWCTLAHEHGRLFHYGRAATMTRIQYARYIGSDSADTAQPLWSDEKFYPFVRMLRHNEQQEELWRNYCSGAA